jgi:hypothetical protein
VRQRHQLPQEIRGSVVESLPPCAVGSALRYAPVEMTILFEYSIPRFQERSAEPQIPRLRSG